MPMTDNNAVDLDRYCARVGYSGPLEPVLETLAGLIDHHVAAIPFENIDVLLGRGIDISPQAVDAKLIQRRRGGYCYEQNGLFKRVLETIGFHVEALAARVLWRGKQGSSPLPRTHLALCVLLDGERWLTDVGFGGSVPTSPLRLAELASQGTHHETFRVARRSAGTIVEILLDSEWRPLYELSLEPLLDVDCEPPNWFTSTHPDSVFRRDLMVARTTGDARYTLLNGQFAIRGRDGSVERSSLDADALETVLGDVFGLAVEPDWRPLLRRMATEGRQ